MVLLLRDGKSVMVQVCWKSAWKHPRSRWFRGLSLESTFCSRRFLRVSSQTDVSRNAGPQARPQSMMISIRTTRRGHLIP